MPGSGVMTRRQRCGIRPVPSCSARAVLLQPFQPCREAAQMERPEFSIVSGVSAGALIAPFAFLGPEYDLVLQEFFIGDYLSEFQQINAAVGILGPLSAAPLRRLVAFVDQRMLERIAEEHKRGRRLIVVTTRTSMRSAAWSGAIAGSSRPDRLDIFRNVLVASASIPGVFAPVLIEVVANGRHLAEMHVDGGVTHNVFIVPDTVLASSQLSCRGGASSSSTTSSHGISRWWRTALCRSSCVPS